MIIGYGNERAVLIHLTMIVFAVVNILYIYVFTIVTYYAITMTNYVLNKEDLVINLVSVHRISLSRGEWGSPGRMKRRFRLGTKEQWTRLTRGWRRCDRTRSWRKWTRGWRCDHRTGG